MTIIHCMHTSEGLSEISNYQGPTVRPTCRPAISWATPKAIAVYILFGYICCTRITNIIILHYSGKYKMMTLWAKLKTIFLCWEEGTSCSLWYCYNTMHSGQAGAIKSSMNKCRIISTMATKVVNPTPQFSPTVHRQGFQEYPCHKTSSQFSIQASHLNQFIFCVSVVRCAWVFCKKCVNAFVGKINAVKKKDLISEF